MIRVLLLGQWHSLSDRELERALTVRLDFMLFCGQSMIGRSPARTTICRFRRMLGLRGLDAALLSEVNRQLQERGLKVGNAPVAVVDATIVESAARPRRQIEVVAEDRAEGEAPHFPAMVSDGTARSRFMGRRAVEAELTFKSMALNLLKAANRIKLVAA